MRLDELKRMILKLPPKRLHDLMVWANKLDKNYRDVPAESLNRLAAEIWDRDDRLVPPTHPAKRHGNCT
jgi:hypothetical protein